MSLVISLSDCLMMSRWVFSFSIQVSGGSIFVHYDVLPGMEVFIVVDTDCAPILNIGMTAIQRLSCHAVDVQTEGCIDFPMILLTEPTGGCDSQLQAIRMPPRACRPSAMDLSMSNAWPGAAHTRQGS